jgi:hypothetical protein
MSVNPEDTTVLITELAEAERLYADYLVNAIIEHGASDRKRYVDAILELCRLSNQETAHIVESLSLGTFQPALANGNNVSLSPAMTLPHDQWLDSFEHGAEAAQAELKQ